MESTSAMTNEYLMQKRLRVTALESLNRISPMKETEIMMETYLKSRMVLAMENEIVHLKARVWRTVKRKA